MSALVIFWTLTIVLGAAVVLQGIVLRAAYRRRLARQQARHLQLQQTASRQFEQSKRQIGQLQNDLAAARLQLKQLGGSDVASTRSRSLARQVLERELDATSSARHSLPVDGFADTQPSPSVTQHGSLLLQ